MINRHRKCGFILVDVLVAVTILLIGLVVLSRIMMVSANAVTHSANHTKALWRLEQIIDEVKLGYLSLDNAGGCRIEDGQFTTVVEVIGKIDEINKVRIQILWEEYSRPKRIEHVIYVFNQPQ